MKESSAEEGVAMLLRECNVMSLATWEGESPWSAALFFVADDAFNLYFVSAPGSRHSRNLASNPEVSLTINKDHDDWLAIRGLQVAGVAGTVPAGERDAVERAYLEKFPQIARLLEAPSGEQERRIAEGLASASFYRVTPKSIRLIDNSLGFGFKRELALR